MMRRETGIKNLFNEIMSEKFPYLKKEQKYSGTGSTRGPKQDEPKQTHTNIYQK